MGIFRLINLVFVTTLKIIYNNKVQEKAYTFKKTVLKPTQVDW